MLVKVLLVSDKLPPLFPLLHEMEVVHVWRFYLRLGVGVNVRLLQQTWPAASDKPLRQSSPAKLVKPDAEQEQLGDSRGYHPP